MAKKQQKRSSSALSLFDAVSQLDEQDSRADVKRRRTAHGQIEKARQVQAQTKIYHSLMETRILLQRALVATTATAASKPSPGSSSERNDDDVQKSCDALLTKLLEARQKLTAASSQNFDTKSYDDMIRNESNHEDDDSSVDDGDDDDDDGGDDDCKVSPSELQSTLQNEYDQCREEWKTVLNRRHKDLKLQSGGLTAKMMSKQQSGGGTFQVMDASFWQQVESVREYEDLRRRQQQQQQHDSEARATSISELFDDSKVYQQLLKDFVSQSTAAAGAGKGGTAFQNSTTSRENGKESKNKNNKKKVDRRASKGRKLRFNEIPKLVNFTFPLSRGSGGNGVGGASSATNFLNQDEYFQSLFGGSVSK